MWPRNKEPPRVWGREVGGLRTACRGRLAGELLRGAGRGDEEAGRGAPAAGDSGRVSLRPPRSTHQGAVWATKRKMTGYTGWTLEPCGPSL